MKSLRTDEALRREFAAQVMSGDCERAAHTFLFDFRERSEAGAPRRESKGDINRPWQQRLFHPAQCR